MKNVWTSIALFAGLLALVGCGPQAAPTTGDTKVAKEEPKPHDHLGWWCEEHGVVEAECSVCQKAVFKKLNPEDICPKHPDRAKAQCFICNPELWEKSKAVYKAKFDKDPPEPAENAPPKK